VHVRDDGTEATASRVPAHARCATSIRSATSGAEVTPTSEIPLARQLVEIQTRRGDPEPTDLDDPAPIEAT